MLSLCAAFCMEKELGRAQGGYLFGGEEKGALGDGWVRILGVKRDH